MRWPGHVPVNTVTSQQFAFYDFFPTAAALAGIDPNLNPPHIDGQSVAAVLAGGATQQPSFVYHHFWNCIDANIPEGVAHSFCQNVRMGQWSGVCVGDRSVPRVLPDSNPSTYPTCFSVPCDGLAPGSFWLYNITADIGQRNDVAATYPEVVARILAIMKQQYNPNWPGPAPPPPPSPPTPPSPMPPPCTLNGTWWGRRNHNYTLALGSGNNVTLHVTDGCCAWRSAVGVVQGHSLHVVATGPDHFTLGNEGKLSQHDCAIEWTHRWAPWRKLE